MGSDQLFIDEVFLSLQGEGLEVGRPHLFLRLGGCPLRCSYCDTPRSWHTRPQLEVHANGRHWQLDNPLSARQLHQVLTEVLASYQLRAGDVMLAVTGGEPVQQSAFLAAWLPTWGGQVLLETAGIEVDVLQALLPHLHLCSMDWKFAEDLRAGASLLATQACLLAAKEAECRLQVKLLVHGETSTTEVEQAVRWLHQHCPQAAVFLQPVTPFGVGPNPPSAEALLQLSLVAQRHHRALRVLPQIHPMLGIR